MERVLEAISDLSKHVDKRIDDVGKQVDERCRMLSQKIDDVKNGTAVWREKTVERLAAIEEKERNCQIAVMGERVEKAQTTANAAKIEAQNASTAVDRAMRYVRATVMAVLIALTTSVLEAFGIHIGGKG